MHILIGVYLCVICKQETSIDWLVDNLFSLNAQQDGDSAEQGTQPDKQTQIICTNCDENNFSQWYCTYCNELLCEDCRIAHSRVRVTKDHILSKINNYSSNDAVENCKNNQSCRLISNCQFHTKEKLSLFCETCDILTCRDCQLSPTHKEHKYKYLKDAATAQRSKFTLCLNQLKQRKLLIKGNLWNVDINQL